MDDLWLATLKTETPQDGIELAVKLSRLGVMLSQPSDDLSKGSHLTRKHSPPQLIAMAHVIALNFQTVAAANDWWRSRNRNDE